MHEAALFRRGQQTCGAVVFEKGDTPSGAHSPWTWTWDVEPRHRGGHSTGVWGLEAAALCETEQWTGSREQLRHLQEGSRLHV